MVNNATVKLFSALGPVESMPANPRTIAPEAMERLKASIQRDPEFMRLRPIVVGADGIVIGGNQRLRACAELGIDPLPDGWVVRADSLTDEQRRRFILIDNAPEGMSGAWDVELLKMDWKLPELDDLGFEKLLAELTIDAPPVEDRAGASPWDRVGDAAEGVIFSFGDVQCRLPVECYERFKAASPESEIASWVEGVIRACSTH